LSGADTLPVETAMHGPGDSRTEANIARNERQGDIMRALTLRRGWILPAVLAAILATAAQAVAGDIVVRSGYGHPSARPVGLKGRDSFEPNSERDSARQIFFDRDQLHTIWPDGDEDWIMFVPRQAGRYVLRLTDVTTRLEGEIWAYRAGDKERRVEKFKIGKAGGAEIHLDVGYNVRYFKFKIEADDGDDTGSYRMSVSPVRLTGPAGGHLKGCRPDVYEHDDERESAIQIGSNTPQLRTIYPRDDEDWVLFVPPHAGTYRLEFTNVTVDLEGEVWARRSQEKERRVDKFEISRRSRNAVQVSVGHDVRYLKFKIEADDNDDTGEYQLSVVPVAVKQTVRRPVIIVPPILRRTIIRPPVRVLPVPPHRRRHPSPPIFRRHVPTHGRHQPAPSIRPPHGSSPNRHQPTRSVRQPHGSSNKKRRTEPPIFRRQPSSHRSGHRRSESRLIPRILGSVGVGVHRGKVSLGARIGTGTGWRIVLD